MAHVTKTERITLVVVTKRECGLFAKQAGLNIDFELVSRRQRVCPTYDITVSGTKKNVRMFFLGFGRLI